MSIVPTSSNSTGLEAVYNSYVEPEKEEEDPLGRDAFLTMLVAQLKHQDPLNPMDGTAFTAQLAQFSSLEQQFGMNDSLESILTEMKVEEDDNNLLDYIGKEISADNNTISVTGGSATKASYTLEEPGDVIVSIVDSDGMEVQSFSMGQKGIGTHELIWDAKNGDGGTIADGVYKYQVVSIDANGVPFPAKTAAVGIVNGVTYENGKQYLIMKDQLVDPDTVIEIRLSENGIEDSEE